MPSRHPSPPPQCRHSRTLSLGFLGGVSWFLGKGVANWETNVFAICNSVLIINGFKLLYIAVIIEDLYID